MKVVIEMELDQEAYDKEHGPGSDWWLKYGFSWVYDHHEDGKRTLNVEATAKAEAEAEAKYKVDYSQQGMTNSVVDCLCEDFYDWDRKGWLKLKVNGVAMRECCKTLETEPHKGYCEAIVGPEAS